MKAQFAKRMAAVLCAALLCAACLCAQPRAALAAADYTMDFSEDAFVSWSGKSVNYSTADASGTGWSWAHASKTLTLSGLSFETTYRAALILPAGATLVLAAGTSSTVTSTFPGTGGVQSHGIVGQGALTITGDGSLTATGGMHSDNPRMGISYGLVSVGDLTVSGNARVVCVGRTGGGSIGIAFEGDVTVKDNASVTAQGGLATDSASTGSLGMFDGGPGASVIVSGNASLRATGGHEASSQHSVGIYANNGVRATGGTVIVTGEQEAVVYNFDMSGYTTDYYWRTSPTGAYTASATQGYTHTNGSTYVEIRSNAINPPVSPKTGDGAPLALWAGLCLLAGAGTIAVFARRRRRNAA